MRKIANISAFLLVMVAFAMFAQNAMAEPVIVEEVHNAREEVIGGDADERGCIATAGYLWSEEKQACTRPWEENLDDAAVIEHDASNGERVHVPIEGPPLPDGEDMENGQANAVGDYDHAEMIGIGAPIAPGPDDSQGQETVIAPKQEANWLEWLLQALRAWLPW